MKRFVLMAPLLFIFSACATTSLPDRSEVELPSAVPFDGANVILVDVGGDPESIRERVVQSLRVEGYDITQATLNEGTLETEPKVFGSGTPGSVRYFVDMPENAEEPVRLYGRIVQQVVEDRNSFMQFQSYAVTPGGQRLSLSWQAWRMMNDLAGVMGAGDPMYDHD